IEIPSGLSILTNHDPNSTVQGLNDFPADQRPPVFITHFAFDLMVGTAFGLIALGAWFWYVRLRQKKEPGKRLLQALSIGAPFGFIALECGWMVTEIGRQPWIIYHVMRTTEGVTPDVGVPVTFFGFSLLYLGLGATLTLLLIRLGQTGAG